MSAASPAPQSPPVLPFATPPLTSDRGPVAPRTRRWNLYRVAPVIREVNFAKHGEYLCTEFLHYSIIPLGATLIWTLVALAYWLDDDLFWDAFV